MLDIETIQAGLCLEIDYDQTNLSSVMCTCLWCCCWWPPGGDLLPTGSDLYPAAVLLGSRALLDGDEVDWYWALP